MKDGHSHWLDALIYMIDDLAEQKITLITAKAPKRNWDLVERKRDVPWLTHTFWWFVHNCIAHLAIGVLPLRPFFKFHDWTSYRMHGK